MQIFCGMHQIKKEFQDGLGGAFFDYENLIYLIRSKRITKSQKSDKNDKIRQYKKRIFQNFQILMTLERTFHHLVQTN